jgi:M6 family metalloprotease-like protein
VLDFCSMKARGLALVIFFLNCSGLWSLEPPTKQDLERYAKDGSLQQRILNAYALGNHIIAPELVWNLRSRLEPVLRSRQGRGHAEDQGVLGLPPGSQNVLKSEGTPKVLALLLSFPEYQASQTREFINAKLFQDGGQTEWPYESLRNYYRRSSYNMLDIQGNTLGWYTTSYPRNSIAQTTTARENLIKEALRYYDSQGHDFSQYDNDGNGVIDYFLVIWTGPDNGWGNFWWGYQTTFADSSFMLDGKSFYRTRYSWQWESRPYPGTFTARVAIHETGHALGLPDYYDYDSTVGPKGGLGGLDMMDANTGDHNCFSKMLLDWISPQVFNYGTRPSALGASATTQDALILMPEFTSANPFDEFFAVQNRFRAENDFYLPGDGLLIWHVDARLSGGNFLYNNSYTSHKLLRLMEADGQEHIERGYAADSADYYVSGKTFGPDTFPNSQRYDGTLSGVSVGDIGPSGQMMKFSSDIHYVLQPPQGATVQRLESDFIFFREYVDQVTWAPSQKNRTPIAKYVILVKAVGAPDSAYILLAELAGNVTSYEHHGLKKDELYTYGIVAIDANGVESPIATAGKSEP